MTLLRPSDCCSLPSSAARALVRSSSMFPSSASSREHRWRRRSLEHGVAAPRVLGRCAGGEVGARFGLGAGRSGAAAVAPVLAIDAAATSRAPVACAAVAFVGGSASRRRGSRRLVGVGQPSRAALGLTLLGALAVTGHRRDLSGRDRARGATATRRAHGRRGSGELRRPSPRLLVRRVRAAPAAVLAKLDPPGIVALRLLGLVVTATALLASEGDADTDVSAGHGLLVSIGRGAGAGEPPRTGAKGASLALLAGVAGPARAAPAKVVARDPGDHDRERREVDQRDAPVPDVGE